MFSALAVTITTGPILPYSSGIRLVERLVKKSFDDVVQYIEITVIDRLGYVHIITVTAYGLFKYSYIFTL